MIGFESLLLTLFLKPLLVIGPAAVLAVALRRRTAAARHAVWSGAMLATLALPILMVALPPLRVPMFGIGADDFRGIRAARRGEPAMERGAESSDVRGSTVNSVVLSGARFGGRGLLDRLPQAVAIVWIAGVVLLMTRRIVAELRVRRILRRARDISSHRLQRLVTELAESLDLGKPALVRLSDDVTVPAVAGWLRPVVLLPSDAEHSGDAYLTGALSHELGHVRRHDCFLNLCTDIATILYWCNPVLHLARARMRAESERACDDLALSRGAEPEEYAQLLLDVARLVRRRGGVPAAATAMARPNELESRLLAVLDDRVARGPISRWVPAAVGAFGLLLAAPAAALTFRAVPLVAQPAGLEPDRLADSVAHPSSERLTAEAYRVSLGAADALTGADGALARLLTGALDRRPTGEEDLVRERAAWALNQIRDGQLIQPLIAALAASDWRVQSHAAWALAIAHDARAVPSLIPLLQHPVWRVRAMAAFALRELRDPRASESMILALTDPAWQVRLEAVGFVAATGGADLRDRLRPLLTDRHVAVRRAAEEALLR